MKLTYIDFIIYVFAMLISVILIAKSPQKDVVDTKQYRVDFELFQEDSVCVTGRIWSQEDTIEFISKCHKFDAAKTYKNMQKFCSEFEL